MKQSIERTYSLASSCGTWTATFSDVGLRDLRLPGRVLKSGRHPGVERLQAETTELRDQEGAMGCLLRRALAARLAGKTADLPWEVFDLRGRPQFYQRVWKTMHGIPFGTVWTYGALARRTGSPRAVRAVGGACGANPVVLFIPCHRVVGSSGPGGFGAGLDWKRRLLRLEGLKL